MAKIKTVILGIGIMIVLSFFFGYGINTFYKPPKYEDFCGERLNIIEPQTQKECEDKGGKWNKYPDTKLSYEPDQFICTKGTEKEDGTFLFNCEKGDTKEARRGYCDNDYFCRKDYDSENSKYNRNVFVITIILGIIAILVGTYLKLTSVSAGIMGGGVLTMLYGAIRYWADMNEYVRFAVLTVALAVLIWLGYKRFKK